MADENDASMQVDEDTPAQNIGDPLADVEDVPTLHDEDPAQPANSAEHDEDTPMEDDTPMRTNVDSSDSDSSSESEEEVELLVTSRQKRATAGNRLASLIQTQQEEEDEIGLLFEEVEDDEEYESEEANDVQMSESDDDDQGPEAGADDLEGEKELRKAEKQAKKKKVNDGIPKIFKKRVKIDPTASQGPTPRPKKKSERASWIPTAEEAPTRASQRGTTRQSKEQLHAQMVDREIKRLKQLANMEKAAAAKQAAKKPAMTQADRLAEAARVEKANFKSLSRWEEAEQQREEEQAAKLAALSNRKLEGPVITWWSGKAEWVGGILKKVGKALELEDPKEKQTRKRKAAEMEADSATADKDAAASASASVPAAASGPVDQVMTNPAPTGGTTESSSTPKPETVSTRPTETPTPLLAPPPGLANMTPPIPPPSFEPANVIKPSQPSPEPTNIAKPPQSSSDPANNPLLQAVQQIPKNPAPQPPPQAAPVPAAAPKPSHPPFILAPPLNFQQPPPPPMLDGSAPLPGFGYIPRLPPSLSPSLSPFPFSSTNQHQLNQHPPPTPFSSTNQNQLNQQPPPPPGPPAPPAIEHAARNYLILQNFDETAVKDKNVQTQILFGFGKKFAKPPRMCFFLSLCCSSFSSPPGCMG
jgi:vacuolar protein sorting-associated protein 72